VTTGREDLRLDPGEGLRVAGGNVGVAEAPHDAHGNALDHLAHHRVDPVEVRVRDHLPEKPERAAFRLRIAGELANHPIQIGGRELR